eukprot:scaffold354_cov234-Pinguiococcus_pyrenoidosus.AAC.8
MALACAGTSLAAGAASCFNQIVERGVHAEQAGDRVEHVDRRVGGRDTAGHGVLCGDGGRSERREPLSRDLALSVAVPAFLLAGVDPPQGLRPGRIPDGARERPDGAANRGSGDAVRGGALRAAPREQRDGPHELALCAGVAALQRCGLARSTPLLREPLLGERSRGVQDQLVVSARDHDALPLPSARPEPGGLLLAAVADAGRGGACRS